jgi:hypothetical protein
MNLVCDEWEILAASVGIVDFCGMSEMPEVGELTPLTFGGREQKTVAPGEFFSTDAIELSPRAGQYICLELSFRGRMIPYHEEHMIPIFVKGEGGWCATNKMPLACMMGCDRPVDCRIGFIGDSITQGLGTPQNSFTHYAAVVADILGEGYSYWDLGIGFARANDARHFSMRLVAYNNDIKRFFRKPHCRIVHFLDERTRCIDYFQILLLRL